MVFDALLLMGGLGNLIHVWCIVYVLPELKVADPFLATKIVVRSSNSR